MMPRGPYGVIDEIRDTNISERLICNHPGMDM